LFAQKNRMQQGIQQWDFAWLLCIVCDRHIESPCKGIDRRFASCKCKKRQGLGKLRYRPRLNFFVQAQQEPFILRGSLCYTEEARSGHRAARKNKKKTRVR
ncbi:MAG: hypothetical protein RR215_05170, partial [Ruthenibacterium sp.]